MARYRALGVLLLAAVALLAAAAGDDHMHQWRCFKSCARDCQDEVALGDGGATEAAAETEDGGGGVSRRCKTGCLRECFEDLPALCYEQCVVSTCLCLPPYSKEKVTCMKDCCDKCFHHGPPAPYPGPMPPRPGPPKPGPMPPRPGPPKPGPLPPTPAPPKPKPPTPPPAPSKPKPPPAPMAPMAPKPPKPPCPPGQGTVNANN